MTDETGPVAEEPPHAETGEAVEYSKTDSGRHKAAVLAPLHASGYAQTIDTPPRPQSGFSPTNPPPGGFEQGSDYFTGEPIVSQPPPAPEPAAQPEAQWP